MMASSGTILGMAHHPTHLADAGKIMLVHGFLDLLAIASAYGLFHMALRRGLHLPTVLAGCVFYAAAFVANLGATVVNGFVLPQIVNAVDGAELEATIRVAIAASRTLAVMGVVGTGAAFVLWSMGLVARRSQGAAPLGFLGIVTGGGPILALLLGDLRLDKAGALAVYAAHAGWAALAGLSLWRGSRWLACTGIRLPAGDADGESSYDE